MSVSGHNRANKPAQKAAPDLVDKIVAGYALDRARADQQIFSTAGLPVAYENITSEWLSEVACAGHSGAAVTEYKLGVPNNASSNRRIIQLHYNDVSQHSGLPEALFCKASHDLQARIIQGLTGGARNEVIFYNEIRPHLSIEAPRALFARFDPETFNSMVVLPNLTSSVKEFCTHCTAMTRDRVQSQLELLADLHASGYSDPNLVGPLASLSSWPALFGSLTLFGIEEKSNRGFLAARAVVPARLYEQFSKIWPATVACVERHNRLPCTLIHGDVHLQNWYVTLQDQMGLSDWETASRGHWSRDVAHLLSTVLTVEERRSWEKDLLRFYIDRLRASGGFPIQFDEAWRHYRREMLSALCWWTFTLAAEPGFPRISRNNVTLEFVGRAAVAVDDLESMG